MSVTVCCVPEPLAYSPSLTHTHTHNNNNNNMAEDDEDYLLDVQHNALFRALQTQHHKVWQQAQENCWLVCIPKPSISNHIKLARDVVYRHVLRPSPIFKGQYLTLGPKPTKLDLDGNQVHECKANHNRSVWPLSLTLSRSITNTHTHTHKQTHTLSLTHSLNHSLTHTHTHTHSLNYSHPLTNTNTLTHNHSLTHSHTHSHTLQLAFTFMFLVGFALQLVPVDGGPAIRIIHEEPFYNENFEPFKVYAIDSAIGPVEQLDKVHEMIEGTIERLNLLNMMHNPTHFPIVLLLACIVARLEPLPPQKKNQLLPLVLLAGIIGLDVSPSTAQK